MEGRNLIAPLLEQSLRVSDALSSHVCHVDPEDHPPLVEIPDQAVFALFDRSEGCEVFLGLVTARGAAANPDRIFIDLLPPNPSSPLSPRADVKVAWRRFEGEGVDALPVVDQGKFVGVVTPVSVLNAVMRRERELREEIQQVVGGFQRRLDYLADHAGRLRRLNDASRRMFKEVRVDEASGRLFETALDLLVSLIQVRYGALIVLDEQGEIAHFFHTGLAAEEVEKIASRPTGKGLLGDFLSREGTLRLEDIGGHPRAVGFPPGHPPMRTLLAAVIRHEEEVYGRVYLCDRRDGEPFTFQDQQLVEEIAENVGLTVFFQRHMKNSRGLEEDLKVAAQVFESSAEGILVTDADRKIILVNQALTSITGYTQDELIGRTPGIFSSGHHDETFYRDMWRSLNETGQWQGEIWNRRKNGSVYPEWLRITAITDNGGAVCHYVAVFSDLSDLAVRREGMERLIHFDHLTDLPNRLLFRAELKQAMLRTRYNGKRMALLLLDLDRFKTINDTLGHQVGDRLLQQVARRLRHCLRKCEAPRMGDTVARLAGDEFTIILNDLDSPEDAEAVAAKILERFHQPFVLGELERSVTASIGIALFPDQADTLDGLISQADMAMFHAKKKGRNRACVFDPVLYQRFQRQQSLENDLYNALERGQFEIHYQPQVAVADGRVVGLEALLRWNHPGQGWIGPAEFIPMLEETGLMEPVGEWVLRQVGRDYRRCLNALGMAPGTLTVSVNISPRQLEKNLVATVRAILAEEGIEPACLKLELTESVAMDDPDKSLEIFTDLTALGVEICIDDFGTGYSSLSYLTRLPIAILKIDRLFIREMIEHAEDREVVTAIIALAHNLKLQVIAEGVETMEQYEVLRTMGCDVIQGYLFGQPAPLDQLEPPRLPC